MTMNAYFESELLVFAMESVDRKVHRTRLFKGPCLGLWLHS